MTVTCTECASQFEKAPKGRTPQRCTDCKRTHLNGLARASKARQVQAGKRVWIKPMSCLDCGQGIESEPGIRRPTRCEPCKAVHKKPYAADPTNDRRKHLRRKYGMTLEDYDSMHERQSGSCAICGSTPERLHVDHCHTTGKVRSLLCGQCNRMLGLAQENAAILAAASQYLQQHS